MNTHRLMTTLVASIALMFTGSVFADEEKEDNKNPLGCRDMGYVYNMKIVSLVPEGPIGFQSMFFIFNTLDDKVTLFQMHANDGSHSLFLNHQINPKQWAVYSTSEKPVNFICTVPEEGSRYGKVVDCADSIRVCQFNNVKYGLNNKGNYWLVNSNTKNGALREVVRYGIIPAL